MATNVTEADRSPSFNVAAGQWGFEVSAYNLKTKKVGEAYLYGFGATALKPSSSSKSPGVVVTEFELRPDGGVNPKARLTFPTYEDKDQMGVFLAYLTGHLNPDLLTVCIVMDTAVKYVAAIDEELAAFLKTVNQGKGDVDFKYRAPVLILAHKGKIAAWEGKAGVVLEVVCDASSLATVRCETTPQKG